MQNLKMAWCQIVKDQRGATLVEYGIALTVALIVGTVALTSLGGAISLAFNEAATSMPN